MKKLRAVLWLTAAALAIFVFVLPALQKYETATSALSVRATERKNTIDSVDSSTEIAPGSPVVGAKLWLHGPEGTERQALLLTAMTLGVALVANRLLQNRRRALRQRQHHSAISRSHMNAGPIMWNRDIEMIESIGSVGLLASVALPVIRQQARVRELARARELALVAA